ncbi:MAG TPA: IPT/TIG domain-containing protein [Acidimicrobiales bacterium]|nr:IPT/TIG domain-containing protein [Acidimicrobiales bacterium]
MTDHDNYGPELLLVGSDRPRPLPAALRARLEEAITGAAPRPLSADVRDRLENTLAPPRAARVKVRKRWGFFAAGAGAAAAIAVLVGVLAPGLGHKAPTNVAARSFHRVAVPAAPAEKHGGPQYGANRLPKSSGAATRSGPSLPSPRRRGSGAPLGAPAGGPAAMTAVLEVQKLSPRQGPTSGGNAVAIEGPGLFSVKYVLFGTSSAESVTHVSPTELSVVAPRHLPGTVYVTLKGSAGASAPTPAARYTFAGRSPRAPTS